MESRVLILGAGFAGLELATALSESLGEDADVVLIDAADSFFFGYSKLDVLFGHATAESVSFPYSRFAKPGVRFRNERITGIDAAARTVTTDAGTHSGEHLVIALGAGYDPDATPGLVLGRNEFYSMAGAEHLAGEIASFDGGDAVIGVCGPLYKCPPAPSEASLLLHEDLLARGRRGRSTITLLSPLPTPVPPSPETSDALLEAFAESGVEFRGGAGIASVEPGAVRLADGTDVPCDLFLGVPKHRAAAVVTASGLAAEGYVEVDPETLTTTHRNVWACGDVAAMGVPKAGVFAEAAASVVAEAIVAEVRGESPTGRFDGRGSCYVEFGRGKVGRVDVDFRSGPKPTGVFRPPSDELAAEKEHFGASRRDRWF
jgi:sulfide:quinone oxidoreductase